MQTGTSVRAGGLLNEQKKRHTHRFFFVSENQAESDAVFHLETAVKAKKDEGEVAGEAEGAGA